MVHIDPEWLYYLLAAILQQAANCLVPRIVADFLEIMGLGPRAPCIKLVRWSWDIPIKNWLLSTNNFCYALYLYKQFYVNNYVSRRKKDVKTSAFNSRTSAEWFPVSFHQRSFAQEARLFMKMEKKKETCLLFFFAVCIMGLLLFPSAIIVIENQQFL